MDINGSTLPFFGWPYFFAWVHTRLWMFDTQSCIWVRVCALLLQMSFFYSQAFCSVCLLTWMWCDCAVGSPPPCRRGVRFTRRGRAAVRVHPSYSNPLVLRPSRTRLSQTCTSPFQPLCWRLAHKDLDFNQTRHWLFNGGLCLLTNPITSL